MSDRENKYLLVSGSLVLTEETVDNWSKMVPTVTDVKIFANLLKIVLRDYAA